MVALPRSVPVYLSSERMCMAYAGPREGSMPAVRCMGSEVVRGLHY